MKAKLFSFLVLAGLAISGCHSNENGSNATDSSSTDSSETDTSLLNRGTAETTMPGDTLALPADTAVTNNGNGKGATPPGTGTAGANGQ